MRNRKTVFCGARGCMEGASLLVQPAPLQVFLRSGLLLAVLSACAAIQSGAWAASTSLYWVGPANGNFSTASNWSLTSGGAGGTQAPATGYTANLDGNGVNNCVINAVIPPGMFDQMNG